MLNPITPFGQRRSSRGGVSLTPEEEEDLLSGLGRAGLSTLSYLGESLDKPMAAVRGLLAGQVEEVANLIPFSDALGITSSEGLLGGTALQVTDDEDTVYGRDLLETYGILNENKEGFGGNPGDWSNWDVGDAVGDLLGFGIDLVGPPVAAGAKALGRAGTIARKAGVLDDAAVKAATLGQRTGARSLGTLDDAIRMAEDIAPGARARASAAAEASGFKLDDIAGESLGGGIAFKLPGMEAKSIDALNPVLDKVGDVASKYAPRPVREVLRGAFNSNASGLGTEEAQRSIGPLLKDRRLRGMEDTGGEVAELTARLSQPEMRDIMQVLGQGDDTNAFYRLFETTDEMADEVFAGLTPTQRQSADGLRARFRDIADPSRNEQWGVDQRLLDDQSIEYAARQNVGADGQKFVEGRNQMNSGVDARGSMLRQEHLKNIPGGTAALRDLAKGSVNQAPEETLSIVQQLMQGRIDDVQRQFDDAAFRTDNIRGAQQQAGKMAPSPQRDLDALLETRERLIDQLDDPEKLEQALAGLDTQIDGLLKNPAASVDDVYSPAMSDFELVDAVRAQGELKKQLKQVQQQPGEIASFLARQPEAAREAGIFTDPVNAMRQRLESGAQARANAQAITETLADPNIVARAAREGEATTPLNRLLESLNIDRTTAQRNIAEMRGLDLDGDDAADILKAIGDEQIGQSLFNDLVQRNNKLTGPAPTNQFLNATDQATNLWKAFQTGIWPSFHARNFGSGQAREVLSGAGVNPKLSLIAGAISRGKALTPDQADTLSSIPAVRQLMTETGSDAADAFRQLSHKYLPGYGQGYGLDFVEQQAAKGLNPAQDLNQILDIGMPGGIGGTQGFEGVGKAVKSAVPRNRAQANPLNVRGVAGRTSSEFAPAKAGEAIGDHVENLNRLSPFLKKMLDGYDPRMAAKDVLDTQVDYRSIAYTPFENEVGRRLFPFMKFTRQNVPYVAKEIATNPAGRTAALFKSQPAMQRVTGNESDVLPPHVANSLALKVGVNPDGSERYVRGLGLMEEDLAGIIDPQNPIKGALGELLSRSNPLIKAPVEYAFGRSLFQKGRELTDMDPTLARLITNVSDLATGEESKTALKIPGLTTAVEHAAANSPLARLLGTARTLTDKRKLPGFLGGSDDLGGLPMLANLLTGMKVSDVSEGALDAQLNQLISETLADQGGRAFETTYIPDDVRERMTPEESKSIDSLRLLERMLKKRRQERAAGR